MLRLYTMLLVIAVAWSSWVFLGAWGIVVTATVLCFALAVAIRACFFVGVGTMLALLLVALLLPAVSAAREPVRRMQCMNNLKQIALALLNYQEDHKSFPPPYIADKNGKPMHSWRVLILPFMECQSLYDRYDFTEPWDGPRNEIVLRTSLAAFSCPSNGPMTPPHTNYLAIVGPNSALSADKSRNFEDSAMRVKASSTIMLVETTGTNIHWAEPRDVYVDEFLGRNPSAVIPSSNHVVSHGPFFHSSSVVNVAMADGSVHALRIDDLPIEKLNALLTVGGCNQENLGYPLGHERLRINWANCFAFAVLIIATALLLHVAVRTRRVRRTGTTIIVDDSHDV